MQYERWLLAKIWQAFKELLAATKSLLAEHSSRDRSMGVISRVPLENYLCPTVYGSL